MVSLSSTTSSSSGAGSDSSDGSELEAASRDDPDFLDRALGSSMCQLADLGAASHFGVYTSKLVYAGPGKADRGISASALWMIFDKISGGDDSSEALKGFRSWFGASSIRSQCVDFIAGRKCVCNCGRKFCPAGVFEELRVDYVGDRLLSSGEWRAELRRSLDQSFSTEELSAVLLSMIRRRAGGLGERLRLSSFSGPFSTASKTQTDILPAPLPSLVVQTMSRAYRRHHGRVAQKLVSPTAARWEHLITLGANYLFGGDVTPTLRHIVAPCGHGSFTWAGL